MSDVDKSGKRPTRSTGAEEIDKLLSAYVDGVSELDADERKRIDALLESDASARADAEATRSLLARIREMPPVGSEPSWADLEAAIHRQVGDEMPRRPWWRAWRWVIPTGALAATAIIAIILLVFRDSDPQPVARTTPTPAPQLAPAPTQEPASVVWIDDQAIDLDSVNADELLETFDDDMVEAIAADDDATGLLPAADLGWIDNLDDKALDRAESFLKHKKS